MNLRDIVKTAADYILLGGNTEREVYWAVQHVASTPYSPTVIHEMFSLIRISKFRRISVRSGKATPTPIESLVFQVTPFFEDRYMKRFFHFKNGAKYAEIKTLMWTETDLEDFRKLCESRGYTNFCATRKFGNYNVAECYIKVEQPRIRVVPDLSYQLARNYQPVQLQYIINSLTCLFDQIVLQRSTKKYLEVSIYNNSPTIPVTTLTLRDPGVKVLTPEAGLLAIADAIVESCSSEDREYASVLRNRIASIIQ